MNIRPLVAVLSGVIGVVSVGAQLALSSPGPNCGVIRMDLPLRNGFQVRTNVTRGVLVKQVSACKARKVMLDQDGNVVPAK